MKDYLVVVADHARARFFRMPLQGHLLELEDMIAPEGHKPEGASDRPGRTVDSKGSGRHSMEPVSDAREIESVKLARRIGKRTDELLDGSFEKVLLVAGPDFLGVLRQHLSDKVQKNMQEIPKNLAAQDAKGIREAVGRALNW